MRDVWEIEQRAQNAAFAAAQMGATCESVDAAARKVITDAGFGPEYKVLPVPRYHGPLPGSIVGATSESPAQSIDKAWGISYKPKATTAPRPVLYFSFGALDCLGEVAIQSMHE